ncbi:MAG: NAD/NADP octopine/nopaline dehydrogenase family protein [Mangrovibacterium sp.]
MKIAVIGAGNGGQAISAYLALCGNEVTLFDRSEYVIDALNKRGSITLQGALTGSAKISKITHDLADSILGAKIIMVATTANAHGVLARQLAPYLKKDQIVVLNPGRTGGALEFRESLAQCGFKEHIYVAEVQTLVYACRIIEPGVVNIIGIKEKVLLSALPSSETSYILEELNQFYPCFIPAQNVLVTSFENIGAIFHPSVVLFNAATIERGTSFYFYRDMTPYVAEFIEAIDAERIMMGKVYGINIMNVTDWVSFAYGGIQGNTLCERMKNNPAYYEILAPSQLHCRQIYEDIPTGFVPMLEFGRLANAKMPLFESMLSICSQLLHTDFTQEGRSLAKLGLSNCRNVEEVIKLIE